MNNSDVEMDRLKADKENIRNIKLVKEPQVSFEPVGKGRRQTVILAGSLSLVFGAFLAFFMEFLQRSKHELKS